MAKQGADVPPMPPRVEKKDLEGSADNSDEVAKPPAAQPLEEEAQEKRSEQLPNTSLLDVDDAGGPSPHSVHESPVPEIITLPSEEPTAKSNASPTSDNKVPFSSSASGMAIPLAKIEVSPLTIRKRTLTDPPKEDQRPTSRSSKIEPTPTLSIPEVESPVQEQTTAAQQTDASSKSSSPASLSDKVDAAESVHGSMTSVQYPSVPQIVIENRQSVASVAALQESSAISPAPEPSKHDEIAVRKAGLTLNPALLDQTSQVPAPLATGNMTGGSIGDFIGRYMVEGSPLTPQFPETSPALESLTPNEAPVPSQPQAEAPARPRPKPAAVQPPDPSNFLSPPPTGFRSAVVSSGGSSFGTISSNGSRPMSMIETSPGQVSRALRMTPATGRGVPVFLPPTSSRPRKSDFVYFPPSPEGVPHTAAEDDMIVEEDEDGEGGFGVVTLGHHGRRGSEPDLTKPSAMNYSHKAAAFKAVVHGKVRETPASATMPRRLPQTPQPKKAKRATILETPLSPGHEELAALLQEAMLLEDSLDRGQLPGETPAKKRQDEMAKQKRKEEEERRVLARAREEEARKEAEERHRIAHANAQLQAKRDAPTQGRLKHTFLVPLSKAKTTHKKELSSTELEAPPRVSHESTRSKASTSEQHEPQTKRQRSPETDRRAVTLPTPQTPEPKTPSASMPIPTLVTPGPTPPSKSPRMAKFSSFKRFGSISKPSTIDSTARYSVSTSSEISSEDSTTIATPPDNALEFGLKASNESLHRSATTKNSMTFPSLSPKSPKKAGGSIGRATSFAEKMFSRGRTKSNGSVLSSSSQLTVDEPIPSLPPVDKPPSINLPSLSNTETRTLSKTPSRNSSLKRTMDLPPIPQTAVPALPPMPSIYIPANPYSHSPEGDSLVIPSTDSSFTRPSSMTSLSSAGSLPSPLFDQEIFDAFPSVPGTTPTPVVTLGGHRREQSLAAAAVAATADFDSAFLSSAIHIAAKKSQRTAAPVSRAKTPTQTGG
ncbi:hypothetical protein CPB83DRAFT_846330 [Crepidotus variabilis]|uniref:Uncharacterized protein n=1 Tax=Crepidotus variabilis TaxID=179855 RepID=A0A9P6JUE7_9AGAR|nr:hypothetical protein CPB83DRAFT_846330 [Crepidotus variabilis]